MPEGIVLKVKIISPPLNMAPSEAVPPNICWFLPRS
jgi:hypothetical protein